MQGAALASVALYGSIGIGIIKGAILARLITAEFYGVIALATVWASYISVLRFELGDVIVSDADKSQARLVVQFVLEVGTALAGLLLAILFYACVPWIASSQAWLYDLVPWITSQRVWFAIFVIIGIRIFEALTSTPLYILRRDIRQDVITRLTLIGAVLALVISVIVAYLGYPLLSLLLDTAIPVLVAGVGAWLAAGWRPSWVWKPEIARDVLSFGFTLWTGGLWGKITFEFDDWLVGNWRGERTLGFYSKAYSLAKMPMDVFAGVIGQLAVAMYTQSHAAGRETLARAYELTTWLLMRVVALSSVVMLAATEEIVRLYLGPNWDPVVPLLRLMFLYALGRPLWQNNAQLLVAVRREKVVRQMAALQALFLLVAGPPMVYFWGAAGASVAVSLMIVIGMAATQWHVSRQLQIKSLPLYLLPSLLTLLLVPLLYALGWVVQGGLVVSLLLKFVISLLLKAVLALVLFGGISFLLERKRFGEVYGLVVDNLLRKPKEDEALV